MPFSPPAPSPRAGADRPSRRLLFVCTGNICRSPMAEYLLRHHLGRASEWAVASAGLYAAPGLPASPEAVLVLREKGVALEGHRSRPVTVELLDGAAWIVVMTQAHAADLQRRFPLVRDRVRLMASFDSAGGGGDIHDPLGGSVEVYRTIRDAIDACLLDLILFLRRGAGGGRPAPART